MCLQNQKALCPEHYPMAENLAESPYRKLYRINNDMFSLLISSLFKIIALFDYNTLSRLKNNTY